MRPVELSQPSTVPIAVFVYDRPKHVRRALAALEKCARFDECDVHIFSDGPKSSEAQAGVAAARQVVHEWAERLARPVHVTERAENLGLARSIVAGVSKLCAACGQVIVVEDDLVVGPAFVNFMLQALDKYRDAPQVYQIAGYMFATPLPPRPAAFFLPVTTTWGWATWQRAWQTFEWEPAGALDRLTDLAFRSRFELDQENLRFTKMLKQQLAGLNDSWGILWRYAVINAGGLVLYPRESLVWNGGFDGTGVNSGRTPKFPQPPLGRVRRAQLAADFRLPDELAVDEAALDSVRQFLRESRHLSNRSLAARVRSGLRRRLAARDHASNP